jgi:hypothetical protein
MTLTALPDGCAARYSQTVAYADRRNGELRTPNGRNVCGLSRISCRTARVLPAAVWRSSGRLCASRELNCVGAHEPAYR